MRRFLTVLATASALALSATAANAATTIITPGAPNPNPPGDNPPGSDFYVSGNIYSGSITAHIADAVTTPGDFTDIFAFTIPQTGTGSGSITTSVNIGDILGTTDLDIYSVVVNGMNALLTYQDQNGAACTTPDMAADTNYCGVGQAFSLSNVPITAFTPNTITVTGLSRGNGSYGGNLTFTPATSAVPEPGTWGMMLLGFGAAGMALRFRRRRQVFAQAA